MQQPETATRMCRTPSAVLRSAAWMLLLWLLAAGTLGAQPQHFRHYGPREGLMQAQVISLHQDQAGFLWAGTYGGFGRFNGRSFAQYSTADGLTTNTVQAIASEADGTVWAGLARGLCALRPQQIRFECPPLAELRSAHVQALLVSTDGLWVGTSTGLYLLQRDRSGQYQARAVAPALDVSALASADGDRLWVGGRHGLARIDAGGVSEPVRLPRDGLEVQTLLVDGGRLWIGSNLGLLLQRDQQVSMVPGMPAELGEISVSGLALGPDGALWAATRLGLLRERQGTFVLLGLQDGLSNEGSHAVILDRENVIWIGGDHGLSSYVAGAFVGYLDRDGLMQNFVRTIDEDAAGRLWLGTRQGVQVVQLTASGQLQQQLTITRDDGLVDDRIYDIAFLANGDALLATSHGVAHWRDGVGLLRLYTEEDGLPSNAARAFCMVSDGRIFIGTNSGVVRLHDGEIRPVEHPELAEIRVFSIREDARGRLWFGSLQHGLLMLDTDGRVQRWTGTNGLSDEIIWHTAPDADGGVWIGTNGDGLFHIDSEGAIVRYTTHDGLADNFVWQVLVDRQGHVWAYTNNGLSRFDGSDFSNYSEDDGLLHPEGSATAAIETTSGERWFAASDGLMRFVGHDRHAVTVPPVLIEQALVGGEPMQPGSTLAAGARSLEFHFSTPLFQRNSDLRYRYRLRGADSRWTELRSYRPIAYANLGAGKYVFEVQARLAGGDWPAAAARVEFAIGPTLWQRPWVWLLFALLLVFAAWVALRLRLRQLEARRRVLEALVRERTVALEHANQQLKEASFTDPLTGLRNRRYLTSQVGIDVAQVRRAYAGAGRQPNSDLMFVMIDIDHFKAINDCYGHATGDRVLCQYAELICELIRESDYAVRWGGEEFVLVARQTEAEKCALLAERIVTRVRDHAFYIDDAGTTIDSTCSVGVSHIPFADGAVNLLGWERVIEICDAAVYLTKAGGRDGWVAIRGVPGLSVADPAAFMQRLKNNPVSLVADGCITISGPRAPAAATATDSAPQA